jgi:hypothetical protein
MRTPKQKEKRTKTEVSTSKALNVSDPTYFYEENKFCEVDGMNVEYQCGCRAEFCKGCMAAHWRGVHSTQLFPEVLKGLD